MNQDRPQRSIEEVNRLLQMQAEMSSMVPGNMGGCTGCEGCGCGDEPIQDLDQLANLILGRQDSLNQMQVEMDQLGTPEQAVLEDAEAGITDEQRERVENALFDAVCVTGGFTFRPHIKGRVSKARMEQLIDEMVEGLKKKGLELIIDRVQAVSLPA